MNDRYVLVDTNIASFLFRKDPRANLYTEHIQGKMPCLSAQSHAEMLYGAYLRNWGERRLKELKEALSHYVTLPADVETAEV